MRCTLCWCGILEGAEKAKDKAFLNIVLGNMDKNLPVIVACANDAMKAAKVGFLKRYAMTSKTCAATGLTGCILAAAGGWAAGR
jgi:hypothetical protein